MKKAREIHISSSLELLRLSMRDNIGVRFGVPFLLLKLNRDDDAFSFVSIGSYSMIMKRIWRKSMPILRKGSGFMKGKEMCGLSNRMKNFLKSSNICHR